MKATVVPNRNKIFASIIQAVALSIANETDEQCDIAMGIHAGDHAILLLPVTPCLSSYVSAFFFPHRRATPFFELP